MRNGIIFGNKIIDIVFISTILAQAIKVFSPCLKKQKPNFSRMFETGGMPSSHSSSVTSLCTCVGLIYGVDSVFFAVCLVQAIVVMYDATGIRREAGKHAKALNQIIMLQQNAFESEDFKKFKEFLGHTPLEVLAGAMFGILITFLFRGYLV